MTPVKSMYFNHCCEVECSNYGQSELARLAIDAYDYESVHGAKPKVWVQMSRTPRVKKYLANTKKRAAKGTPDEETTEADDNLMFWKMGEMSRFPSQLTRLPKRLPPRKPQQTKGSSVQCAKETCTTMLATGPGCNYCSVCGSNQDFLEAAHFKEVLLLLKN